MTISSVTFNFDKVFPLCNCKQIFTQRDAFLGALKLFRASAEEV